ncbi:nuclear transport factor 2 family protein [Pendulispora brunnea]|uniref:Nuclear transport factor 2 family protein n=1 Tax=Pendulispora brunnea TaxID=2905690 RepID=A0ABZ2KHL3_9BACT
MSAQEWIARLEAGWKALDPERIAALFTPDAVYHQGPFGTPHVGCEAIRNHWIGSLSRQVDPKVWFGKPIESEDCASVEWWCILHDPVTLTPRTASGVVTLRFAPDGRCTRFHEYWHAVQDTSLEPPEGWFS